MPPYTKPYLTVPQQIALLEARGMVIADHAKATEYLSRLGYYRLSAYWYPFRDVRGGQVVDDFKPGTQFSWALDLYSFDKKLRLQLLDVLERIEIFIRTGIALELGQYHPEAHRNPKLLDAQFSRIDPRSQRVPHTEWLQKLDDKARDSKEEFTGHFRTKYPQSFMPVWVAVELLDFGPLSRLLSGMRRHDVRNIAATCGVPDRDLLTSWVRALSVVRNVCAHHARLWNKPLVDQPRLPKRGVVPLLDHLAASPHGNRRVYAACAIARYLLLLINPRTQWSDRLKASMGTFPVNPYVTPTVMGFPQGWETLALWS